MALTVSPLRATRHFSVCHRRSTGRLNPKLRRPPLRPFPARTLARPLAGTLARKRGRVMSVERAVVRGSWQPRRKRRGRSVGPAAPLHAQRAHRRQERPPACRQQERCQVARLQADGLRRAHIGHASHAVRFDSVSWLL